MQLPPFIAALIGSSAYSKMAAFVSVYVVCLLFCVPGSSTFDYGAGYTYGFCTAVALVALSKGIAAIITYFLVQALRDSQAIQRLQRRSQSRTGSAARWASRIKKGVQSDCFRFCMLARLAPLQASFVNYVLSVAGVPFTTYLTASILGMLPPICNNVYTGVAAKTVQTAVSSGGKGGTFSGMIGVLLVAVSMFSSAGLLKQLAGGSLDDEEGAELEAPRGSAPGAAAQAVRP